MAMELIVDKSNNRGKSDFGWLKSFHSFSFGNYFNPQKTNFGVLRVLNDDIVSPMKGFGMHPHSNMEIISIVLDGELTHQDNMGNESLIKQGDIQVMSAGKGVLHSEHNKNKNSNVEFLQIWVIPFKTDVQPRYQQISIQNIKVNNQLSQILSPNPENNGVWIYQNAWFYWGEFSIKKSINYKIKSESNGVYLFVIEGKVLINNKSIEKRDAVGIRDVRNFNFDVEPNSILLLMDVPIVNT